MFERIQVDLERLDVSGLSADVPATDCLEDGTVVELGLACRDRVLAKLGESPLHEQLERVTRGVPGLAAV